jgi:hypothetical protein
MTIFRSRYVRRVLVPVMAVSVLSACVTWKGQEMAPSRALSEKEPWRVRLTMLNGDRMELGDPVVSDGEIVGRPFGHWCRESDKCALRVPTDSVANIEIREADALATTALVVTLGLVVGGAVAAVVIAFRNWNPGPFWKSGGGW